jgi:hypothetical protein
MIEPWRRAAHRPSKAENAGTGDGKPGRSSRSATLANLERPTARLTVTALPIKFASRASCVYQHAFFRVNAQ